MNLLVCTARPSRRSWAVLASAAAACALSAANAQAQQRAMGVDISYWNSVATQANWQTAHDMPNANGFTRQFAFIRASRGGTTGLDQPQGTPGGGTTSTFSKRYDDPNFVQNINRATTAGMLAGPYHFARPDVAGNTGADEAIHFMQMAGAWMRPGYLVPTFDQEAGAGADTLAQFALDFSDQIYTTMKIRPAMYINGNYANILSGATAARRDALAKPATNTPSVNGAAYPVLWNARYYVTGTDAETIPVQTGNPKDNPSTLSTFYGPWDDYGNTSPWNIWQYSSAVSVPGLNAVDSGIDGDVSHGDIEYMRNFLVPAVWFNDSNGDWSSLTNWNSGQPVVAPATGAGQAAPLATGPLPVVRLPGAAGSGPTSGQYDTVILERASSNITVTLSTGTHNIRKLYMRETLNITGGSLEINYDPTYRADTSSLVLHGGPFSAQFSGPVTLSGTGSLNVHTLLVDQPQTFTVSGGTLTFNTINLTRGGAAGAKILLSGDATFAGRDDATATIVNSGSGANAALDLGGGTRVLTVSNGGSAVDLDVGVPIQSGGLNKAGAGTMQLSFANTYTGTTTVSGGTLQLGLANAIANASPVSVTAGATLKMNGFNNTVASVGLTGGAVSLGAASLTSSGALTTSTSASTATITGSGTITAASMNVQSNTTRSGGGVTKLNGTLTVTGAKLDLTDTRLITQSPLGSPTAGTYSGVSGMIQAGYNGGAWNGNGIITSVTAAGAASGLTTLAVAQADHIGKTLFGGAAVTNETLIMYTYAGDATLDGRITGDDYFRIDASFGTAAFGYENGDFNYDGKINADDYFILDRNYHRQSGTFASGPLPGGISAVPEPASLGAIGMALMLLGRRRRR